MINPKKILLTAAMVLALVSYTKASASHLEEADPASGSVSQSHGEPKGKAPLPELPTLPDEVWLKIIGQIDRQARNSLALVNQDMRKLVRDPIEMSKRDEVLRPRSKEEFIPCITKFADAIKNGVEVDLSYQDWVDDKVLAHLANATTLDLRWSNQITDAGLAHLSNVTTINLAWCEGITDAGLEHLSNATTLNLSGCHQITDEGLEHLTGAATVTCRWCRQITDAGLAHLTNATTINLEGCVQITDAGLEHLTNVQDIYLRGCPKISEAAKEALREKGVHVRD